MDWRNDPINQSDFRFRLGVNDLNNVHNFRDGFGLLIVS